MTARFIEGDALSVLKTMPDASVDLVVTSPPFLALRSYLPADDPNKPLEMGSEPTPGQYIDALLDVTEELARVLAPHGSICVELGDTYSGSGGSGGDYDIAGLRDGQPRWSGSKGRQSGDRTNHLGGRRNRPADVAAGILAPTKRPGPEGRDSIHGWPLAKSLTLIPELYRFALAYGLNPLTGRTTPTWRVRNVVRWHRPNPPVGALGDKFRPSTSDMVIACKSTTRFFDLDAVRTVNNPDRLAEKNFHAASDRGLSEDKWAGAASTEGQQNPLGGPPLDTWVIPTSPYRGAHYAVFPAELIVKPIKAMCPAWVCTSCGEPQRKMWKVTKARVPGDPSPKNSEQHRLGGTFSGGEGDFEPSEREFVGMSECDCVDTGSKWRRGVVLDPFVGSGTTLVVASGHGHDSIGIDLDSRNLELARQRIGMFLEESTQ